MATSALSLVQSSHCDSEADIAMRLQSSSRDILKACRAVNAGIKMAAQSESDAYIMRHKGSTLEELMNDSVSGYEV